MEQNHGFFDIMKQSFKTLWSQKKLFTQLVFTLLLPFSIICLGYVDIIFPLLVYLKSAESRYARDKFYLCILANLGFISLIIPLALFWVAAAIYSVASLYSNKPISFKIVIKCVPKIWVKLLVTYLWSRFFVLFYTSIMLGIYYLSVERTNVRYVYGLMVIIWIIYSLGAVYLCMLWGLGSVISVLQDTWGLKAFVRAKTVVVGKNLVAGVYVGLLGMFLVGVELMELELVINRHQPQPLSILFGVVCVVLFTFAIVVAPVFQTILYFVCMACHQECVDRTALSVHLEALKGQYQRVDGATEMNGV